MKERFVKYGYEITTDPTFQNKRYGIPPELDRQLERLAVECQNKKNRKIIHELTQLVIKYPLVPMLKNYLSVAYNVQGNYKKALEVNHWVLTEHPDYLFAKLNQAHSFIEEGRLDEVPGILGEGMEIKQLYPERSIFHLAEITGFLRMVIRYFVAAENLEQAENRFEMLEQIAPDHHDTEQAELYLISLRIKTAAGQMVLEQKQRISTKPVKTIITSNNKIAPQFNHPEINDLYRYGLQISHEKLREILALPRQTLIRDLENILKDAVNRYGYFSELGNEDETHSFPLHALFLLSELNSGSSLPLILEFLEADYDFLQFWLGDHKTETIWQCFYRLGLENHDTLKAFLLKPGIDTYAKTAVSVALCQMVLHHPEKREEIKIVYSEIFNRFAEASPDDNLVDSDFLGLVIGDTIDCQLSELLPVIKILYDKNYVALGINGSYSDVEKLFSEDSKFSYKREVYSIFELYDHILSTWYGYNKDKYNNKNRYNPPAKPVIPHSSGSPKVGRNDPCPCGSGFKHKKCCGK